MCLIFLYITQSHRDIFKMDFFGATLHQHTPVERGIKTIAEVPVGDGREDVT